MKRRYFALIAALVLTGAAVTGVGFWLKRNLDDPHHLYDGESAVALPFLLLSRGTLWDALTGAEPTAPATTAAPTETTQAPTTLPEPTTAATTLPPETTEHTVAETTAPTPTIPQPIYGQDETFFDDALFIGDSRMCGLRDYARLGEAEYFCDVGMNIFNMWDRACGDTGFDATDLGSLLSQRKYGKIYIALGINECGFATSSFRSEYRAMVEAIREYQPDALIVLQSIMGVTRGYAANGSHFLPSHLAELNDFIHSLADDTAVFYIDVNQAMADAEGYLLEEATWDGCHLKGSYNSVWAAWLCYSASEIIG